jgi:uncharacterized membrane protein YecN with MAPEG domain
LHIAPFYAAFLAVLFVALSVRTVRMRRALRIAVGDGRNEAMLRAMRAHANFSEYVPLGLLLVVFVETGGAPAWLVHALGSLLVVGRLVHAVGISRTPEDFRLRVFGMSLTFTVLVASAVAIVALRLG